MRSAALLSLFLGLSAAISQEGLYPYGEGKDFLLPPGNDISTNEIPLQTPVYFYDEVYSGIYVNTNGILSFRTEIPTFFNVPFPLEYPLIAPFYSNVDTGVSGKVWYRETSSNEATQDPTLRTAEHNIRSSFSGAPDFHAESVFLATWENVGFHGGNGLRVNTFQVALTTGFNPMTDTSESYVELLYPEGGLQWLQGAPGPSGLPDVRAQAAIGAEDGRIHKLKGSGTDQVLNLERSSNTGVPGQWLYQVGPLGERGDVIEPDTVSAPIVPESEVSQPDSCAAGGQVKCHSRARCQDTEEGFCCRCDPAYYGNGLACLKRDVPLRVNGKLTGTIDGKALGVMELQSYVVMADGRAYTALSKVPPEHGYQMQVLHILGSVIGWLFAKPIGVAQNGYQLTGGVFNHTADITFPGTDHKVTVVQRYSGLDLFDQLRLEGEIFGTLPSLTPGAKVELDEYYEEYSHPALGDVRSTATRSFRLKNGGREDEPSAPELTYEVSQRFSYEPCKFIRPEEKPEPMKLKVSKNFIGYESRERILRYGMSDKVSLVGDRDPCVDFRCGEHSACVSDGVEHHCVCDRGYHSLYGTEEEEESVCVDVNECQVGIHGCDVNAKCINEPGSFHCECHPGFSGDGRRCQPVVSETCEVRQRCSPYATCDAEEHCVCLPGYAGDGRDCSQEMPDTTQPPERVRAYCIMGQCTCPDGYYLYGGEECRLTPEPDVGARPLPICSPAGHCSCPEGYDYNREYHRCQPIPGYVLDTMGPTGGKLSCNIVNTCHPHAQCVYSARNNGEYFCECTAGYTGDGIECNPLELSCREADICDPHATCERDDDNTDRCVCSEGFIGDGYQCILLGRACSFDEECGEGGECSNGRCQCVSGYSRDPNSDACIRAGLCGSVHCAQHASCLWDADEEAHYCECDRGFVGEGHSRCEKPPPPCNEVDNCALHATCQPDRRTGQYSCVCDRGYRGDGATCRAEPTCADEPGMCDPNARCTSTQRGPRCICSEGYTGDGRTCQKPAKHDSGFLLLNQGMATLRVPFNSEGTQQGGRPIQVSYYQMAIGIDVDCSQGRVYWTDIARKAINSSEYNGTYPKTVIDQDVGTSEGIAIDWHSRLIFWTDSSKLTVEVASLENPSLRKVLVNTGLVNPRGIAVHPQRGKVFWSDWNRHSPRLEWCNMDGSDRAVFFEGPEVVLPNSLAIDWQTDNLCYVDAGTKSVQCIHPDTKRVQTKAENLSYPFGLAITRDHFYWTDWESKKIESVDRHTGTYSSPIPVPLGGSGNKLYGIVAVEDKCPAPTGYCGPESGNTCSLQAGELCLPNPQRGYTCACADPSGTCNSTTQ